MVLLIIKSLSSYAILLLVYGIVVRPCSECSNRRALVEMDNPCIHTRVVVDSVDVVSMLEATFVCFIPHG